MIADSWSFLGFQCHFAEMKLLIATEDPREWPPRTLGGCRGVTDKLFSWTVLKGTQYLPNVNCNVITKGIVLVQFELL
jgi:hypothetical protein